MEQPSQLLPPAAVAPNKRPRRRRKRKPSMKPPPKLSRDELQRLRAEHAGLGDYYHISAQHTPTPHDRPAPANQVYYDLWNENLRLKRSIEVQYHNLIGSREPEPLHTSDQSRFNQLSRKEELYEHCSILYAAGRASSSQIYNWIHNWAGNRRGPGQYA